jgi:hypothetical protein
LTLYGEPRAWLDRFPKGEPVELGHGHLGMMYRGEIIRARSWSPVWGEPLTGGTYFRIVLLGQRRGSQVPVVNDPRIGVCLPASGLTRRRNDLTSELATIRETQALYPVLADTDADLIRTTLRRRQDGLEDELMGEESVSYSQGAIAAGTGPSLIPDPSPAAIFAGVEPANWFSRLSEWLLERAYPGLPLDQQAVDRPGAAPITGEDAADLYRACLGQPGAKPGIMREIGQAQGLSTPSEPDVFQPSGCPGFALLEDWLRQQPAEADFRDAHRHLAHDIGLTEPFGSLLLLLFVRFKEPEFEISLTSPRDLKLLDGSPLLTGRLTKDLLPLLAWAPGIAQRARGIGPITEPDWPDALQHLSYLAPGVAAEGAGGSELISGLENLSRSLSQSHGLLSQLYQVTGDEGSGELAGSLERLASVAGESANGFHAVYHPIRGLYPDLGSVAGDVAQAGRIADLGAAADDLLGALSYLEGSVPPESGAPDLSVQRQGLQTALSLSNLVQPGGKPWDLWAQEVARFKEVYSAIYRKHHDDVQMALPQYLEDLASARRKVNARGLLDQLQELGASGSPAGSDFSQMLDQLDGGFQPCQLASDDLELGDRPTCAVCGLSLESGLAVQELARSITGIDAALGEKNRLLGESLVGKIMEDADCPRLDDLLNIVQASDLSAVSDTLNDDLLAFIRRVLV